MYLPTEIVLLSLFFSSFSLTASLPSPRAIQCCSELASKTRINIQSWPGAQYDTQYAYAKSHYWSDANAEFTPACVVFPRCAEDVSGVIQILLKYPEVTFATKSGGHNANIGFASTDGVLISMAQLNSTTISADRTTAYLSPGATWMDAVGALEPYNKAVVGGRLGDVGVGGLLMGCGMSFLSAQHGLACDNIKSYEVVLSNGSIVNANKDSSPDLFWALKGGGNQFGIVTKFTVNTVPIGQVWGGVRIYSQAATAQLLTATQDFTENFHDPKAAVIVTFEKLVSGLEQFWAVFFFYDGPAPPAGVFDEFNGLATESDSVKTQSYSSLLTANAQFGSVFGLRYIFRGATIPNLAGQNGTDLVKANFDNFLSYTSNQGLVGLLQPGFVFTFIYQPKPVAISEASARVNPAGNLLGLSTENGDQQWMGVTIAWLTRLGDADAYRIATDLTDNIVAYTRATYPDVLGSNARAGRPEDGYKPAVFMNDAMADQKVFRGYGADTFARLKSIQTACDPIGFFPNRTGGFKLI
ncbi:putative FAD binding domain containing protein [Diplocarpon rosae]|nr:putative FAD binding domain containing protein [Diplocarpon rosae]